MTLPFQCVNLRVVDLGTPCLWWCQRTLAQVCWTVVFVSACWSLVHVFTFSVLFQCKMSVHCRQKPLLLALARCLVADFQPTTPVGCEVT